MSLAILRPRVERLLSSERIALSLTRDRLAAAIAATRPSALADLDGATLTLDELTGLATESEREAACRLDVEPHLQDAALRYSRRRPLERVAEIAGTGDWSYPVPAGWVEGFSVVRRAEYPAGGRPPAYLGARGWWMHQVPEGTRIAFHDVIPAAGETVLLTFTAPHELDAGSTTLPVTCWDTVVKLAAGSACLELAAFYSHDHDQSLQLDGVRHGSKGGEFQKRGEAYRKEAEAELPELRGGSRGPAAAEISFAGEIHFLTH